MKACRVLLSAALPCLCVFFTATNSVAAETQEATGVVFQDKNKNETYDEGEKLLSGIRVSNGREITKTDDQGRYTLPVGDDTILFVIKPRGWISPLSEDQLPRFHYIHKPKGSPKSKFPGVEPTGPLPESVDFPLYKQKEPDQFQAIIFGDTQPRDQKEIDYIAHDVIEELIGSTDAKMGITLGDIMFDDLSLFGSLNRTIGLIGIPWFNVIGNHDINKDAQDDEHSDETFERVFGPSYYSFDWGTVHFLVLDDVRWVVEGNKREYRGGLGEKQMEFIRNDLALIPEDQLVVLCMHIPLVDVEDRQELYRLIERRPFCMSLSAHTHYHEHTLIGSDDGWLGPKPHHHVINVTVCGSWWSGLSDETGIPHTTMRDGAPNGYSIMTFDGQNYSLKFKAARRPKNYQMNITAPEVLAADAVDDTFIYVNVFNALPDAKVEMRLGKKGPWVELDHHVAVDPSYLAIVAEESKLKDKKARDLPGSHTTAHLWRGKLPADVEVGTHLIQVRATETHAPHHAAGDDHDHEHSAEDLKQAKENEKKGHTHHHNHVYRGKKIIRIEAADAK